MWYQELEKKISVHKEMIEKKLHLGNTMISGILTALWKLFCGFPWMYLSS